MRSGSTVIHVVEIDAETWDVREPGSERALSSWFSRSQAVRAASDMLREGRGGKVRVGTADGRIEEIGVSAGKRPWWQLTGSPSPALLMGGLWGVLTLVLLVLTVADHRPLPSFLPFGAILAMCYLGSAIAQIRRSRRR